MASTAMAAAVPKIVSTRGGARHLGGRAGEPEDELAVGLRSGDVLQQLERDVRGVEIRENQHVGGRPGALPREV